MPVHFYQPEILLLLLLIPVLAGLYTYAGRQRKKALAAFGSKGRARARRKEAISTCIAAGLVILAMARPAWDREEQQLQESGRDVIFLLDVSRSMLAEDLFPNRLGNAKTAIADCVESLSGDRVGLVLFAGSAQIICPLTLDYEYFRMSLHKASPESVSLGGTMLANALEKTVQRLLDPEKSGMQDVILITDGEDLVEGSDEIEAVQQLYDVGARLIVIGIGDRMQGSRIAVVSEDGGRTYLKHGHREVWTRLNSEILRRMAEAAPNAVYYEIEDGPFDLTRIYSNEMEHAERTPTGGQRIERFKEKFHLFLLAGTFALLAAQRWRAGE